MAAKHCMTDKVLRWVCSAPLDPLKLNAKCTQCDLTSLLHSAVLSNNIDLARYLLQNGVTLDPMNSWGATPFEMGMFRVYTHEEKNCTMRLLAEWGAELGSGTKPRDH